MNFHHRRSHLGRGERLEGKVDILGVMVMVLVVVDFYED